MSAIHSSGLYATPAEGLSVAGPRIRPMNVFYRCALPAIWLSATLVSWKYPGDEYLMFVVISGLPGVWLGPLFGPLRLPDALPVLLAAGLMTLMLLGWLMDGLRVRRALWLSLLIVGVPALVLYAVYPDYQRAMAKNGSLLAYVSAGTNLSLYVASIVSVGVTLAGRAMAWGLRSWTEAHTENDRCSSDL
jgi:hypothetical protein